MKKLFLVLMVLSALLAYPILAEETATAEVTTTAEDAMQNEVVMMSNNFGAQVRLLELQKAITRNIAAGNEIIAAIKEKGNDTSDLEAVISEMELLLAQVKAADPTAENAVQTFVDLKQDAIDLSKEFREKSKPYLKDADVAQLKEKIKNINQEAIKQLKAEIQQKRIAFNAEKFTKIYQILGISDTSLIDKYKNGEATEKEIKEQIKAQVKTMSKEQRKAAFAQIKEMNLKKTLFAKDAIEKAKLNNVERKEARIKERLTNAENIKNTEKKAKTIEIINKRLSTLTEKIQKIDNKQNKVKGGAE